MNNFFPRDLHEYIINPIILVRHGQAESNVSNLIGGWSQTALTDLGRHQAQLVAARLKNELEHVEVSFYCSDLKRAAQTAEIIAEKKGVKIIQEEGFREMNNGIADGKTREEVEKYRVPPTRPVLNWREYPGAETWREFYIRVSECMENIIQETDKPLLIVAHEKTIALVVAWWIRFPPDPSRSFTLQTYYTGITILFEIQGVRAIERHNDVAHLQHEGARAR